MVGENKRRVRCMESFLDMVMGWRGQVLDNQASGALPAVKRKTPALQQKASRKKKVKQYF